ncbi:hypothetical protein QYE76_013606 [Lolium multiflorum]|uniref:CCHC-type domain-containing protein n=1 Tax=Lolium multiflorum TaxID=4521 RepID=A0AAD8U374_LOLMU|nr:hypothetical protein QYE76_013606 [Lolium multiflorum]
MVRTAMLAATARSTSGCTLNPVPSFDHDTPEIPPRPMPNVHADANAEHACTPLWHGHADPLCWTPQTTASTCVVTNHVEEIKELKAQVTSLKNDLVKSHEGKCKLDTMLSVQQSPSDKSGLGFKSNNKNKSKNNKNKNGQVQVKDPAKIVCFKCNIEGHHVRSCPLKKKQKGKRPQAQTHIQPQVEEIPLPKKKQANAPIVEKPSEKKEKKRTCYICREKGHISSLCTIGTSSNSITIDDVYSLLLFSAVFGFRNPSNEIFSELDEIAQVPILPGSIRNTREPPEGACGPQMIEWRGWALAALAYGVSPLRPSEAALSPIKPLHRKPLRRKPRCEKFQSHHHREAKMGDRSLFRHLGRGSAPEGFSIDTAAISTAIFITVAAPMRRE